MAQIDITELLVDPDFVDPMQVLTRTPLVTSLGENIIEEKAVDSFGSVQPADFKTIQKLPESLQDENIYSFWFKGMIIATDKCKYPSIIVFKGNRYQVMQVADWSNWGAGFTEGICVMEKPA